VPSRSTDEEDLKSYLLGRFLFEIFLLLRLSRQIKAVTMRFLGALPTSLFSLFEISFSLALHAYLCVAPRFLGKSPFPGIFLFFPLAAFPCRFPETRSPGLSVSFDPPPGDRLPAFF